ncbi:Helicase conserved C-terminal domain [Popillia japonica]|uniref:Helicase conserved C-terminal domain n=1 Tax=Popillia japonica TaxID=7064 RepID=A0AAW1JE96_POPJA
MLHWYASMNYKICTHYMKFGFVIDVEDVKFVINFDYPSNSEDYVHRIGRTGRSQRTGTAYTFFTPNNANKATDLVAVLKEAKQVINPKLQEMADSRAWTNGNSNGRGRNRWGRSRQQNQNRSSSRSRSRSPRRNSRRDRSRSRERSRRRRSRSDSGGDDRSPPSSRSGKSVITPAPQPPLPPSQPLLVAYQPSLPPPAGPYGPFQMPNGAMWISVRSTTSCSTLTSERTYRYRNFLRR